MLVLSNGTVAAVPAGGLLTRKALESGFSHITFSLDSGHQKLRLAEQAGFRGWGVCPGVAEEVGLLMSLP